MNGGMYKITCNVDEVHRKDDERLKFKMEVLKVFCGDALLRQISEAV